MQIVRVETLISCGEVGESETWVRVKEEVHRDIEAVDWPPGSGQFTIYPEEGKKRGRGNGVKPIKDGLMRKLGKDGWKLEEPLDIAVVHRPGKIDAVLYSELGPIALEWETGNISSSHRALNKMALGLLKGCLAAGMLVVPSRALYRYLTDRVGNFLELAPYLDLWRSIPCRSGALEIVVVEHDATSLEVPRIAKGTDGRALA